MGVFTLCASDVLICMRISWGILYELGLTLMQQKMKLEMQILYMYGDAGQAKRYKRVQECASYAQNLRKHHLCQFPIPLGDQDFHAQVQGNVSSVEFLRAH